MAVWVRSHRRFRIWNLPLTEEEKQEKREEDYTLTGWAPYTETQYTVFTGRGLSPPLHYFLCTSPPTQKQYTFSEWADVDEFWAMGLWFTPISLFDPQEAMVTTCGGVHTPILGVSPGDLIGEVIWEEEWDNPSGPDQFYLCKEFSLYAGNLSAIGARPIVPPIGDFGVTIDLLSTLGVRLEEPEEGGCGC